MKYRAILFDFDGTLTPSLPLWVKAFHIALRGHGISWSDEEVVRRFFYRDWDDAAKELPLLSGTEFRKAVGEGLRETFREAVLFPSVVELLARCRDQGLRTALVTSAPRLILEQTLPRFGISAAFDSVVCADDVKNFKPHPEPVVMTLAALSCAPHHALMVGDSTADVLAGKAAGTATALYMPSEHQTYHPFDALRASGPDHIFADHAELPAIIGLRSCE